MYAVFSVSSQSCKYLATKAFTWLNLLCFTSAKVAKSKLFVYQKGVGGFR